MREKVNLPLRVEPVLHRENEAVVVYASDVITILEHLEEHELEKFNQSLGFYVVKQILKNFTDAFEEEDNDGNERIA